jgi:hypothetical protein
VSVFFFKDRMTDILIQPGVVAEEGEGKVDKDEECRLLFIAMGESIWKFAHSFMMTDGKGRHVLLASLIIQSLLMMCWTTAFLTNFVGYHVGGFLFSLLPENNVTIGAVEFEQRQQRCMGSHNMGLAVLVPSLTICLYLSAALYRRFSVQQ